MARLALGFDDITVPADIDGPPELFHALAGFGVTSGDDDATRPAAISVIAKGPAFHVSGHAYLSPFKVEGVDAAVGSVMAGLAACKALAVDADTLCIHGAAARFNDRTCLFLAPFGTGKSSLMAELALLGAAILSDDVVLVTLSKLSISGLRIPMRLRRGFVQDARPAMAHWIETQRLVAGPRYTYLTPALLDGTAHRLTDIILLNRATGGGDPVQEAASPGAIIPRLLWHNMSRHHPPSSIAQMAGALASDVKTSILHVTDAASTAGKLFRGEMAMTAAAACPPLLSTRRDDILVTRTDRGAIISDDQTGRIFEINESAFVILTLLQQVDDDQAVLEMLATVYPDAPRAELGKQVRRCLRQFADCGLVDVSRAQSFTIASEQGPTPC